MTMFSCTYSLGKQNYKVGFSNEKPEALFECAIKDYDPSLPVRPLEPDKVWALALRAAEHVQC